jgi:hypothetical protein
LSAKYVVNAQPITAIRIGAIRFAAPGEAMQVFSGRHPLLVAQGIDVVAFDHHVLAGGAAHRGGLHVPQRLAFQTIKGC